MELVKGRLLVHCLSSMLNYGLYQALRIVCRTDRSCTEMVVTPRNQIILNEKDILRI